MNAKVEELDLQLKEQLKSNSLLLSKLVKIRGEGRDEVRIHAVLDLLEDPGLDVAEVLRREKKLLEDLKAKEKKSEQSQSRHLPVQPIESKHNEPKGGDSNRQPVITRVRPRVEQSKDLDEEPKEEEEEGEEGRDDEEKDEEEGVEDNTGARKTLDDGDEDIGVEEKDISGSGDHNVIPLLLFSCNRPTVNRFETSIFTPGHQWWLDYHHHSPLLKYFNHPGPLIFCSPIDPTRNSSPSSSPRLELILI